MTVLSEREQAFFWERGYLVVENAVTAEQLAALRREFDAWVEESRGHAQAWGDTADGRPRFDLEPGHSAETPALRRVNSPVEISDSYYQAMADSRMTDMVADLIGPAVKFHHSKINSKLPGAATQVKWHQDFPFTPHSNDDLVTALLMIDEVTDDNGPLEVAPGSHRGAIHRLWHDGVFTGAIEEAAARAFAEESVRCVGPAGAVCLMHTRLAHGSAPNVSSRPRTLLINVYSAEDAVPLSPNPVPSKYEGLLVRGERSGRVRSKDFELLLPRKPTTASFFNQQAGYDG